MGSKMFDRYPQPEEYIPYNRPRPRKDEEVTIMAGETTVHSFEVPAVTEQGAANFKVIYKLGLDVVIEKSKGNPDVKVDTGKCMSIITCTLKPAETNIFRNTLLDAWVQVIFEMTDGSTACTEILKIKLEDSL